MLCFVRLTVWRVDRLGRQPICTRARCFASSVVLTCLNLLSYFVASFCVSFVRSGLSRLGGQSSAVGCS